MNKEKPTLISRKNVVNGFNVKPMLASILMGIMRIPELNRFYRSLLPIDQKIELFQKALKAKKIKIDIDPRFYDKLPEPPFITISNHAYGLLDGMILSVLINEKYPGYKITANFLIAQLEPMKELFIPVNPFDGPAYKPMGGSKAVLELLKAGKPVGLFPAGEVATRYKHSREIKDKQWMVSVFKLIKEAKVPVVPVYFRGTNSRMFHLLGRIHPYIRTIRLIKEYLHKKKTSIRLEIGKKILSEEYCSYENPEELRDFFREKVFELKNVEQIST
ncbi:MAG: 1-acyl-sn-glycerol-3-phosphate acyltransferase [Candidatus Heimdallarchaeota archaeon]|nr:1-acyl-sn-glycerol-3-phosphate acyltransferase [Candidatus Heimdallarchaeota archaeon]